jgi:AraC-like DNA-binding protein
MSVSGFHQHFKSVTAMSPLRFQKLLRFQETHNASHFSREYKSLFGLPPMRDVKRLWGTAGESTGLAAD